VLIQSNIHLHHLFMAAVSIEVEKNCSPFGIQEILGALLYGWEYKPHQELGRDRAKARLLFAFSLFSREVLQLIKAASTAPIIQDTVTALLWPKIW
jgi:hypothetical protein